jgi:hypothetical protein
MVLYTCQRCLKEFDRKSNYTRHINKKNKCKEISSNKKNNLSKNSETLQKRSDPSNIGGYKCEYCNIIIKRKDNLNRHYARCKIKKDNLLKEELFNLLFENQKKQEENYGKQIKILQDKIDNLSTGTVNYNYNTNNTNNTVNSMVNNVNTINVLAYNKTDMSHLKNKDYKRVLRRGNFCVPNLVDAIHFNPDKPENHNIYIPNMKTGFIMCWNGKSWDIRNREDVIDDIYDDKSNLLIDKVDEWEEIGYKLDPIIMTKFKRFITKMDDDIVKNKVKEEIRFLLYNKRNQINNKIKN